MTTQGYIDTSVIYNMRRSGATLQQIGDRFGRTRERVRQILVNSYGSTKHDWLSSEYLSKALGLPRRKINQLYKKGIITPQAEWYSGSYHFFLWSPDVLEKINAYFSKNRLCKICGCPIPSRRYVYCSEHCLKESRKLNELNINNILRKHGDYRKYRKESGQSANKVLMRA